MSPDPYEVLGVAAQASDAEVRAAYRRAVQRHHPDHNGGSAESARRFEAVQEAYAQIRSLRAAAAAGAPPRQRATPTGGSSPAGGQPRPHGRPADVDARLAALEDELRRDRQEALRQARRAAAAAATAAAAAAHGSAGHDQERPSDEELGYIHTDDSFGRILEDAVEALRRRLA